MKLQVTNHQHWCFQKQHKTSLFWNRQAKVRVLLVSSDVLSAHGGGACMAECITRSNMHAWWAWRACTATSSYCPSVCPSLCEQLSSCMHFFKGSGQQKQNHILPDQQKDKVHLRSSKVSACATKTRLRINQAFPLHLMTITVIFLIYQIKIQIKFKWLDSRTINQVKICLFWS